MKNLTDVWEFVEIYYPKYSSCDEIAYNNDLSCIIDDEIEPDSAAERVYNEIEKDLIDLNGVTPERFKIINVAEERLTSSNAYIFEKAIEGYIETLKS